MMSVSTATMPMSMTRNLAVLARGPPTATPLPSLTTPLEATATTSTVPATPTLIGLPRVFTRGRLPARATSMGTVMMATTVCPPTMVSVSAATMPTLMRTVLAVLARGPPTATPPLLLTTPLVATATTSTALATPTPIGLPRVFTRGRPLAPATSRLSVATATATTATTPSMVLRSTATTPRSTRLVMATTLPTPTDSTTKAL